MATNSTNRCVVLGVGGLALAAKVGPPAIISAPQRNAVWPGVFKLTEQTGICTDNAARETGEYLVAQLWKATGYQIAVVSADPDRGDIQITTHNPNAALGDNHESIHR